MRWQSLAFVHLVKAHLSSRIFTPVQVNGETQDESVKELVSYAGGKRCVMS